MSKSKLLVAALPAILMSTAALAAGETIAVFTKNQTNPYFQTVRVGAEAAAKSHLRAGSERLRQLKRQLLRDADVAP